MRWFRPRPAGTSAFALADGRLCVHVKQSGERSLCCCRRWTFGHADPRSDHSQCAVWSGLHHRGQQRCEGAPTRPLCTESCRPWWFYGSRCQRTGPREIPHNICRGRSLTYQTWGQSQCKKPSTRQKHGKGKRKVHWDQSSKGVHFQTKPNIVHIVIEFSWETDNAHWGISCTMIQSNQSRKKCFN